MRGLPRRVSALLEKAKESALLAVDVYNKPKTAFRAGGFVVLMCIAWTALLHAIFEKKKINYFYKRKNRFVMVDGEKKAWDLRNAAERHFDAQSPILQNIKFFYELRNKIEHRFAPEIDSEILGECQSFVLGFEKTLVEHFGDKHSLLDTDLVPLHFAGHKRDIPKNLDGGKVLEFIRSFRNSISQEVRNSQEYAYKVFLIPNVGKNREAADAAVDMFVVNEGDAAAMKQHDSMIVAIKEKRVPVANQGRLKPKMVLSAIKKKTGITKNMTWHVDMWKKYKVRPDGNSKNPHKCRSEFCQYDDPHGDYVYTDQWVDFLIRKEIKSPK